MRRAAAALAILVDRVWAARKAHAITAAVRLFNVGHRGEDEPSGPDVVVTDRQISGLQPGKPDVPVAGAGGEKTPPPVPVLTGLRARDNSVLIEWVSAPVQDLHAFHVYRSDAELDPPTFLACVFTDGSVSTTPWMGLVPSCADVPAVLDPPAAHGSYLDDTAQPHHVYWYRVSALDWLGNESDGAQLAGIPSSSTFTFTSDLPPIPAMLPPPAPAGGGCGLEVSWSPALDPLALRGFIVFRATIGGPYRQVSGIITANGYTDLTARRGVDYLYCVQSIDHTGLLSQPSIPVLHRY
jgi:hypothetical protein